MMHRPCGECRALVGPEGCEHWRPARRSVVFAPSRRQVQAAARTAVKPLPRGLVEGSRRWRAAQRLEARAAREAAQEERAREFLAKHGLTP